MSALTMTDVALGFPEGRSFTETLRPILVLAGDLVGAEIISLVVPTDVEGLVDDVAAGGVTLAGGVEILWGDVEVDALLGSWDGVESQWLPDVARLVIPTASGALVAQGLCLTPERAPEQLAALQPLASWAAATVSWASQLADAERRAEADRRTEVELRREVVRLRELSEIDDLTGLRNRRFFTRHLEQEVSRFRRYGHPLSLAIIDLDRFKGINDGWGHAAGDAALIHVAQLAVATMRESDTVARVGGDEMAVLMPDTPRTGGVRAAERLREAVLAMPVLFGEARLSVTLSIGVAGVDEVPGGEASALYEAADAALYLAKGRGRDQVAYRRDSIVPPPRPS